MLPPIRSRHEDEVSEGNDRHRAPASRRSRAAAHPHAEAPHDEACWPLLVAGRPLPRRSHLTPAPPVGC
jgi:hypothetical protein